MMIENSYKTQTEHCKNNILLEIRYCIF